MEFASDMVYDYQVSSDECISDTELEGGMYQSCSSDSDSDEAASPATKAVALRRSSPPLEDTAVPCSALVPMVAPPPPPEPPSERPKAQSEGFFSRLKSNKKKKRKHQVVHFKTEMNSGADLREELRRMRRNRVRRADTNVVSVKFNQLTEPSNMHTGDAVKCGSCDVLLSHISKVEEKAGQKVWTCEFCGHDNHADVEVEEIPTTDDVTYMLVPAQATTTAQATASGSATDSSLIVFCVDISGSMCVTTEVPGKFELRGAERTRAPQSLNDTFESQLFPGQRQNVTYVSRLQAMQAAVDDQLEKMKTDFPDRRVALVTFNNEVSIIGDGRSMPTVVTGDKLDNWDRLMTIGKEATTPGAIKDTAKTLSDKVFSLEEGGATSLGPALLISIALASQVSGSKVIICTDGMANIGLGSLEGIAQSGDAYEEAQDFYTKCGQAAAEKGVCVSILTIAGNECRTMELGIVANQTSGAVDTVDPLNLTQQFGSILANPIIATNVSATVILHQRLYVREKDDCKSSRTTRHVGNVTADSEITFEYGVRTTQSSSSPEAASAAVGQAKGPSDAASSVSPSDRPGPPPLILGGVESLPFQLQLTYTSREGAQSLRVITMTKPVTRSREEAEKNVNIAVLGAHQAQRSAELAMEGSFTRARSEALGQQRLVAGWCNARGQREQYDQWFQNMQCIDQELLTAQTRERTTMGHSYSDEEDDDLYEELRANPRSSSLQMPLQAVAARKHVKGKKSKSRRQECQDSSANVLWKMKTANSAMFTPSPSSPKAKK